MERNFQGNTFKAGETMNKIPLMLFGVLPFLAVLGVALNFSSILNFGNIFLDLAVVIVCAAAIILSCGTMAYELGFRGANTAMNMAAMSLIKSESEPPKEEAVYKPLEGEDGRKS